MRTCIGCNRDFIPTRKGQKYHNLECYRNQTVKLVECPQCHKKFKRKFSKQVCCSTECANKLRANKLKKGKWLTCDFGGEPVYKMLSKIKRFNFCSNKCKIAFLRSEKNLFKHRKHTVEEIEKIRRANFDRDYNIIFTKRTRDKLRQHAKVTILRPEVVEKTKIINRERMLGSHLSDGTREKIKLHGKYGWKNVMWKGRWAGYVAKHIWAHKYISKEKVCVSAMVEGYLCKGRLQLSNKDHKYRKRIEDWDWRCKHHHDEYDFRRNLRGNDPSVFSMFYSRFGNTKLKEFTIDAIVTV